MSIIYSINVIFESKGLKNEQIKKKQDLDNKSSPKATKIIIAVSILFLLLWSLNLDYIFIESVFPKIYQ